MFTPALAIAFISGALIFAWAAFFHQAATDSNVANATFKRALLASTPLVCATWCLVKALDFGIGKGSSILPAAQTYSFAAPLYYALVIGTCLGLWMFIKQRLILFAYNTNTETANAIISASQRPQMFFLIFYQLLISHF